MPPRSSSISDYSPTARVYHRLERIAFGDRLQRARTAFLETLTPALLPKSHVLLIGDGDGRFLTSLLQRSPHLTVHYVEPSGSMIKEAQKRVSPESQIIWIQEPIQEWLGKTAHSLKEPFSLVSSHFVFDSIPEDQISSIISQIRPLMSHGACWLHSDFDSTSNHFSAFSVSLMYSFFKIFTPIPRRRLYKFDSHFKKAGLRLTQQESFMKNLIYTQAWHESDLHSENIL